MEEKPVYIHYGDDEYRTPNPIKNEICWVKPKGGLWASRKDDEFGWINWCRKEEFRLDSFDRFFEFTLKNGAKVLVLEDPDQLDFLPTTNSPDRPYNKYDRYSTCDLDFEKLEKKYDAIELKNSWKFHWPLYGWDCNCILIMNPDIVEVSYGKS